MIQLTTPSEFTEFAGQKFIKALKGERHKYYHETVKYAELCEQLMSGKGIEKLLNQFYREDDTAFKQRTRITQFVVKSVAQNLQKPFNKLFRSQAIQQVINFGSEASTKQADLQDILDEFWGADGSYNDWYSTRWNQLNFYDPNTYVIFDWDDFDPTQDYAQPYPVEVKSKQVLNYEKTNGYLDWLLCQLTEAKAAIYFHDFTVVITKTPEGTMAAVQNEQVSVDDTGFGFLKYGDVVYTVVLMTPHELGEVPAFKVGYKRDETTNGEVMLSPIDDAFPILIKSVSTGSELDLSIRLHVFPKLYQYVPPCSNEGCSGGKLIDGQTCPKCNGTGKDVHTSSQDVISLNMPMTKDEMVALAELSHYQQLPMEIVEFLNTYIKDLYKQAIEAVFNSDVFTRAQVAETATGQNLAIQNLYDTLYPMATDYANKWQWGVELIADITDLNEGLTVAMSFGRDFKLKSLEDLYQELNTVTTSGASPFIKRAVEEDIARVIYRDNEYEYAKYLTFEFFNPFSGKSPQEVTAILSSQNTTPYNKVLYSNMTQIFDLLEIETPGFYELNRGRQRELIAAKVDEMVSEIKSQQTPVLPNFGG